MEEDIGPEITHIYQVQNRGPSQITKADVTILWPTRDSDGNYLLYLMDQPRVTGKGSCRDVTLDELNPLRLKVRNTFFSFSYFLIPHYLLTLVKKKVGRFSTPGLERWVKRSRIPIRFNAWSRVFRLEES